MRSMQFRAGAVAAVTVLAASPCFGDRGSIVAVPVDLSEPAQRAIIAHDGRREILILGTDLVASRKTTIVEFLPLPSKPDVSLAPEGCFGALQKIVETRRLVYRVPRGRGGEGGGEEEGIKVVVDAHLGPHDVTVVEVKDLEGFLGWVEGYFQEKGLGVPVIGGELREIVSGYLKRGIRFMAFDAIAAEPERKSIRPLCYEFDSSHLYYPLAVTNLYGGSGVIEIFLVLPRGFYSNLGIPFSHEGKKIIESNAVDLEGSDARDLHPGIAKLLHPRKVVLKAFKYEGPLRFRKDLDQALGYFSEEAICREFFGALEAGSAEILERLSTPPFALDRKKVIADPKELAERLGAIARRSKGRRYEISPSGIKAGRALSPPFALSEFDRKFAGEHLAKPEGAVAEVAIGADRVILLLRKSADGVFSVAGFSD
jgi:hypothetical protein